MERKRSCGFRRIFIVMNVNVNECPAGLEPPAGSRNRRTATLKIQRNPLLRFLSMTQKYITTLT